MCSPALQSTVLTMCPALQSTVLTTCLALQSSVLTTCLALQSPVLTCPALQSTVLTTCLLPSRRHETATKNTGTTNYTKTAWIVFVFCSFCQGLRLSTCFRFTAIFTWSTWLSSSYRAVIGGDLRVAVFLYPLIVLSSPVPFTCVSVKRQPGYAERAEHAGGPKHRAREGPFGVLSACYNPKRVISDRKSLFSRRGFVWSFGIHPQVKNTHRTVTDKCHTASSLTSSRRKIINMYVYTFFVLC